MATDDLDPVFRAVADPTRRALLETLRGGPRTTGDLCALFPRLSRLTVVKHLGILKGAGLVLVRTDGRRRWNRLDPAPLRALAERWLGPFQAWWADRLARLERAGGGPRPAGGGAPLDVEAPDSRARSPGAGHRRRRRRRGRP